MPPADAPAVPAIGLTHHIRAAAQAVGEHTQRTAAAVLSRPLTWALFVGFMFGLPLTKSITRELPLPPPVLGAVPAFEFTTEEGEIRRAEQLRGRVWIAEFMTLAQVEGDAHRADMVAEIQHRLRNMGDSARLLSISVEPAADTPERLQAYAAARHTNPAIRNFCTGETAALHAALSAGMHEQHKDLLASTTLAESGYFVLVDPDLRVRGFYPPTTGGVDALILDCALVANLYRPAAQPERSMS